MGQVVQAAKLLTKTECFTVCTAVIEANYVSIIPATDSKIRYIIPWDQVIMIEL